jgi:hypothetical protein
VTQSTGTPQLQFLVFPMCTALLVVVKRHARFKQAAWWFVGALTMLDKPVKTPLVL